MEKVTGINQQRFQKTKSVKHSHIYQEFVIMSRLFFLVTMCEGKVRNGIVTRKGYRVEEKFCLFEWQC